MLGVLAALALRGAVLLGLTSCDRVPCPEGTDWRFENGDELAVMSKDQRLRAAEGLQGWGLVWVSWAPRT